MRSRSARHRSLCGRVKKFLAFIRANKSETSETAEKKLTPLSLGFSEPRDEERATAARSVQEFRTAGYRQAIRVIHVSLSFQVHGAKGENGRSYGRKSSGRPAETGAPPAGWPCEEERARAKRSTFSRPRCASQGYAQPMHLQRQDSRNAGDPRRFDLNDTGQNTAVRRVLVRPSNDATRGKARFTFT